MNRLRSAAFEPTVIDLQISDDEFAVLAAILSGDQRGQGDVRCESLAARDLIKLDGDEMLVEPFLTLPVACILAAEASMIVTTTAVGVRRFALRPGEAVEAARDGSMLHLVLREADDGLADEILAWSRVACDGSDPDIAVWEGDAAALTSVVRLGITGAAVTKALAGASERLVRAIVASDWARAVVLGRDEGRVLGSDITWLRDPEGGCWVVEASPPGIRDRKSRATVTLRPTSSEALRAELRDAIGWIVDPQSAIAAWDVPSG